MLGKWLSSLITVFCFVVIIGLLTSNFQTWLIYADNLAHFLHETPLLPSIINHIPTDRSVSVKQAGFKPPSRMPSKSGCLVVKEAHGLDIEVMIKDTVREFRLNEDQERWMRGISGRWWFWLTPRFRCLTHRFDCIVRYVHLLARWLWPPGGATDLCRLHQSLCMVCSCYYRYITYILQYSIMTLTLLSKFKTSQLIQFVLIAVGVFGAGKR